TVQERQYPPQRSPGLQHLVAVLGELGSDPAAFAGVQGRAFGGLHHRDHRLGVGDQVGELRLGQPGGLPVAFELTRVVPERRRRSTWFGFGFLFRDDTQFGHGESSDGGWKGHEARPRRTGLLRVVPRAPSVWVFHRPTPVTGSTVIPAVITADGPCPPRSTSHPGISGKDPRLTRWTENRGARWFHPPVSSHDEQHDSGVRAPVPHSRSTARRSRRTGPGRSPTAVRGPCVEPRGG